MAGDVTFVVRDRWRCEALLATSPTTTVWRAFDQLLARPVAVRILEPAAFGAHGDEYPAKLLTIAGRLQHENVACLFDAFEDDVGQVLINELIEGPTLHDLLWDQPWLPAEVVAALGVQLAEGAHAIHEAGAIHRDLAPTNVRLTHDGTLKILGLGAARLLAADGDSPAGRHLSTTYLAPEQLVGESTDQRTDIYAIGLILWELAAGAPPTGAGLGDERAAGAMQQELPSLRRVRPEVPVRLSEAIRTATRRDPAQRWPCAQRFADALRPICDARPKTILSEFAGPLLPAAPAALTTLTEPNRESTPSVARADQRG
jgi:eukaryotic-like serine/threonine-protein kinase